VADTPGDEPADPPAGGDDHHPDLEAMEERLHQLGERIATTRTQAEGDDLLPRKDGSGGGGGDAFSDALGFSDRTDTRRSLLGDTGGTVEEPGRQPAPSADDEPGESDAPDVPG